MFTKFDNISLPKYYYRAAAERRLAVICTAGVLVVGLSLDLLRRADPALPDSFPPIFYAGLGLVCGCLLSRLRACIRIDENGIARRRLFRWKTVPWDLIARQQPRMVCIGENLFSKAPREIQYFQKTVFNAHVL